MGSAIFNIDLLLISTCKGGDDFFIMCKQTYNYLILSNIAHLNSICEPLFFI